MGTASKTLEVRADNFASQFNIFDPSGVYTFFRDRMRMTALIRALDAGEWLTADMGDYYIERPRLEGNMSLLTLSATGRLGTMMDTIYTKGTYRTDTLSSFADEVAEDAGAAVVYPPFFKTTVLTAFIASQPHAQAFRLIAQATGTILREQRGGAIEFYMPSGPPILTLGPDDYRAENGFMPSDDTIRNTVTVEHTSASSGKKLQYSDGLFAAKLPCRPHRARARFRPPRCLTPKILAGLLQFLTG